MEHIAENSQPKCKVAHFVGQISDGGAETLIKDYALLLDKDRFNVFIIVLRRETESANDQILQEAGVKIIPIYTSMSVPYRIFHKLNRWWYVPYKLDRILRRETVDVLHMHLDVMHHVSRISSRLKGIRLFYTCHSLPERFLGKEIRPNEHRAAQKLLKNNGLQIIALHDAMRQEIDQMFGIDNTAVIRNGIDLKRFQISESRTGIRRELGILEDAYVVGHVGRFSKVKNHTFIVDIFQELKKRKENAFLLMVGVGELRGQVEEKLKAAGCQGSYLILSNRSDIPRILKAMDVFIFPSFYEGLGIALVEAQVSGLRCVVSDTIPGEAILCDTTVPVSLHKSSGEWCDVILDTSIRTAEHGNMDDYDLNKEIKRLEKLYTGDLNE